MVPSIKGALLAALSIITLSYLNPTTAHSTAWPTIGRSEHVSQVHHEILPRTHTTAYHLFEQPLAKRSDLDNNNNIITKDDTIRLQFSAFNSTFYLHLEPNMDLIHPQVTGMEGSERDEIKVFKGFVVQEDHHSDQKWDRAARTTRMEKRSVEDMLFEEGVVGWARMLVEQDPENEDAVVMRGAFTVHEDTYHVTTRKHYQIQKRSDDAHPALSATSGSDLVIFRDSDLFKPMVDNLYKRANGGSTPTQEPTCGSDSILQSRASTGPPEYYYPPNSTITIPTVAGYDLRDGAASSSLSFSHLLKVPGVKRELAIRAVGPSPVPEGCPINRMVTYMGVAADCTYVQNYGGSANARKQIFADFNAASAIYESTFNVALGVIALNIVKEGGCPTTIVKGEEWNQECSNTYSINDRLSDFSFWRGRDERVKDGAGLWHLMTKCNSGAVVGIAWTKAVCQSKTEEQKDEKKGGVLQYTAGTGVSSISTNQWVVIAHEIGHGFGAIHDCTTSACPATLHGGKMSCCPLSDAVCDAGAKYIMNPSESIATKMFSPCSIKAICGTMQGASCLQAPGTRSTQSSETNICGNGLKEAGEECDCGSAADCAKDPCCDGATCKFKGGAVCDDLNDGCCLNCKLRPAGQVCRKAISECDVEEICTGSSAACPDDIRIPNQTPCKDTAGNNATGLVCANGVCTSRDLQCQQQDRGITKQCGASSSSCDLLCADPSGAAMSCLKLQGSFIDGTSCGLGGTCTAGVCSYSDGWSGVLNWAKNHLAIVIPVGIIVGFIILCCLYSCCCSGCVNRRRQLKLKESGMGKPQRLSSMNGQMPPSSAAMITPQQQQQQYPMGPMPPQPPAPVYYDGSAAHSAGYTHPSPSMPMPMPMPMPTSPQPSQQYQHHHQQQQSYGHRRSDDSDSGPFGDHQYKQHGHSGSPNHPYNSQPHHHQQYPPPQQSGGGYF